MFDFHCFIIHDLLFVFICMFIIWLLSFYCHDYIFHAHVISSLISAHNTYIYDQDCDGACHLKNYFFYYHLPTRGRAGVKLGDADTSQTYLQFLMLHACFYTICLIFCYTSWHFYAFSGTNLLIRCHSASSLFSVVFVFQK
jgi:hypothetical protein